MKADKYLIKALELAAKGAGFVSPNPCVGCVIVKNGKVIGEGWHKKAGSDHAEIVAMKSVKSGSMLKGAEMYVTLSPCCSHGKTPPCSDAIVEAGIGKVFVGTEDLSNKRNRGGVKYLRKNGVEVDVLDRKSKLAGEILHSNQPFIKTMKTGIPYITLKAGMSLDGKIATKTGVSKWITSGVSRRDAKSERKKCDAVLVGAGTVIADNPSLDKLRVIIDGRLRVNLKSKVFRDKNVFVACSDLVSKKNMGEFEKAGIEFKSFGKKNCSIKSLMRYLAKRGVNHVFVEGGSQVNGEFYDAGLIDRVLFYVAPKIFGGEALPVIGGKGVSKLDGLEELKNVQYEKIGPDLKIEGFYHSY